MPVQNAIVVRVDQVVGLKEPRICSTAKEGDVGDGIVGGESRRVLAGNQIITHVIQLVGETAGVGRQIADAVGQARVETPVVDHVIDEIETQVVAQLRAAAVIIGIQVVVKAEQPVAIPQQRADPLRRIGEVQTVGHQGPLHAHLGRIQHRHGVVRAPFHRDMVRNHIGNIVEL